MCSTMIAVLWVIFVARRFFSFLFLPSLLSPLNHDELSVLQWSREGENRKQNKAKTRPAKMCSHWFDGITQRHVAEAAKTTRNRAKHRERGKGKCEYLDRPFDYFRAYKSVDRRFLSTEDSSINRLWRSKIVESQLSLSPFEFFFVMGLRWWEEKYYFYFKVEGGFKAKLTIGAPPACGTREKPTKSMPNIFLHDHFLADQMLRNLGINCPPPPSGTCMLSHEAARASIQWCNCREIRKKFPRQSLSTLANPKEK